MMRRLGNGGSRFRCSETGKCRIETLRVFYWSIETRVNAAEFSERITDSPLSTLGVRERLWAFEFALSMPWHN